MNIGNKIKDLRLAKKLTQQELAGDMITRNMLSRIENGFALPSLQTLLYIAEKLGVPAGYLLAEADEEFQYKKLTDFPDIMRAYNAGDWEICIDLCAKLGGVDDEIAFIVAQCMYNEAKDAFVSGELKQAARLFDNTKEYCAATVYPLDRIISECETYLLCVSAVSPLLVSDIDVAQVPSPDSLSDHFCRYYIILRAFEERSNTAIDLKMIFNAADDEEFYTDHLNAKMKMRFGNHNEAYHILKGILSSDSKIPAPMLYFIFTDLEVCCRELSDYRGAYEYSSDKTGMLEKFLG